MGLTLRRRQTRELTNPDGDRYVDFGVRIIVVRKDCAGVVPPGTSLPRVVKARDEPVYLGGRWDTIAGRFDGPCKRWTTWLVGEKQFDVLFGEGRRRHTLLYSAEGAGKTVLMAMWLIIQVILAAQAGIGGNIGATAPTSARLGTFVKSVTDLVPIGNSREPIPGQWGTLYVNDGDIRTITGHTIQFRSTKQQSAATGAPIQGWNWGLGVGCDELQDSIHAFADIMARLRSGKDAPCMATATAKDSPAWRTFRDSLSDDYWKIERLSYLDAWAVHDSHWSMLKANVSPREWQRRALALDVGPESMVYTSWARDENLTPLPRIGAKDVTARVLAQYGRNLHMLLGHDPGAIQNCTVMLKAYDIPGHKGHVWFVMDEIRTERTTTQEHAATLLDHLQQKWGIQWPQSDEPKCLLRCDPYGTTDSKTDRSVYLTFKQAGFDIRSAAYKNGKGNGRIPKEAGIEMVNRLLCNANGDRRLFIAADERNRPCAPLLVESLELSERDEAGKAETQRKTNKGPGGDLSDFPAALRYALWQVERVRMANTQAEMVIV